MQTDARMSRLRNGISVCHKNDIIFTVRDNGIGMDLETRENAFSLFYSSKGKKGTGLGLFIASKFIGQHGGDINIDSVKGQGALFTVKIPGCLNPSDG